MENLKYLLANGQESMTIRQIADALKEANNLIEENQKLREIVKELELIIKEAINLPKGIEPHSYSDYKSKL
jgi:cell fate (sporulation/competence/biofilm development) regulator YmcA (YheA/YmcA/DUF963 family)